MEVWVNRRQAAAICGCGERNFDASMRPKLPAAAIRGTGKGLRFDAVVLVARLIEQRVAEARGARPPTDEDLLGGPDSPALERFRAGRAELVELDLAERKRELVKLDDVIEAMGPAIAALRTTGERLAKKYGNDAGDIYNDGLRDFGAAAARVLALRRGDPATADPPAAVDRPVG